MKNIKEMLSGIFGGSTAKQVALGIASLAVIGAGITTGVVINKSVAPNVTEEVIVDHTSNVSVAENNQIFSVEIAPNENVSAESIYALVKDDYTASNNSGLVLLSSTSQLEVTYSDGSEFKDFTNEGEFDIELICKRGTEEETYSVLLSVVAETTKIEAVTSTTLTTSATSDTETTTSTTTGTTEKVTTSDKTDSSNTSNAEHSDNADNGVNSTSDNGNSDDCVVETPAEVVKPQQTTPQAVEPAPVAPITTVEPQGMGVHTDSVIVEIPEPVYTEPVTEPQTEPATEPVTEPEVVHGEGCQYFHYDREYAWHCTEGNDGYPSWYDDEDKENFKYAFNEALKYTEEFNAVSWATAYVNSLTGRDKSEVFIGDPTDGEGKPNVWVLQGYNEDGDEIWVTGK